MKKTLLSVCVALSSTMFAQDCSEIFISEYVEGWSNNKALEIYNPTSASIDLSQYIVVRYSNGDNAPLESSAVQLTGSVAAHDVYVAVLDKRVPGGAGQEAPIWDSLEVKGDGFYSPVYNTNNCFYWNGDDCIVLLKGTLTGNPNSPISSLAGAVVVDIFGKIGERPTNMNGGTSSPGGGWSAIAPHNGGANGGAQITIDHSMIRKTGIKKGAVNPIIPMFNPLAEWDSIPAVIVRLDDNGDTIFGTSGNPILDGNWNSLGYHDCGCNPLSVEEKVSDNLSIYPNPSNGNFQAIGLKNIETVNVYNSLGQKIQSVNSDGKVSASFEINQKGVYFVDFVTSDGAKITKKIIVK